MQGEVRVSNRYVVTQAADYNGRTKGHIQRQLCWAGRWQDAMHYGQRHPVRHVTVTPLSSRLDTICFTPSTTPPSTPPLTLVQVVHEADALDGPILLKLMTQLALSHLVAQARHKQRLVGVTLRGGTARHGTAQPL